MGHEKATYGTRGAKKCSNATEGGGVIKKEFQPKHMGD